MKKVLYFMVLLGLVLLGGCYQYRENLVFNPDWSGRISFSIGIDETMEDLQEEDIKEQFEAIPGLRVMASQTVLEDGLRWVEFDVEFDDLEALAGVGEVFSSEGFFGEITVAEDEQGNWLYTRKIAIEIAMSSIGSSARDRCFLLMRISVFRR